MKKKIAVGRLIVDSFKLYGQNWKAMLCIGGLLAVMEGLSMFLMQKWDPLAGQIISAVLGFFFMPVLVFGVYVIF